MMLMIEERVKTIQILKEDFKQSHLDLHLLFWWCCGSIDVFELVEQILTIVQVLFLILCWLCFIYFDLWLEEKHLTELKDCKWITQQLPSVWSLNHNAYIVTKYELDHRFSLLIRNIRICIFYEKLVVAFH